MSVLGGGGLKPCRTFDLQLSCFIYNVFSNGGDYCLLCMSVLGGGLKPCRTFDLQLSCFIFIVFSNGGDYCLLCMSVLACIAMK